MPIVDPADIPTIREIVSDYLEDYVLQEPQFAEMLARLEERESIMITDRGTK